MSSPSELLKVNYLVMRHLHFGSVRGDLQEGHVCSSRCQLPLFGAYPRYCHLGAAAQTDANLSAHLHRLPTPPPYLRRMRLSPGRVRRCLVLDDAVARQGGRCWVANDAAGCPWHSSCKSPRARILVLGTSGAHWPARWPRFMLTKRLVKS